MFGPSNGGCRIAARIPRLHSYFESALAIGIEVGILGPIVCVAARTVELLVRTMPSATAAGHVASLVPHNYHAH